MEFELNFTSNRQRKMFMRNPQAYLVKKVSGAEVCYRKLNAEDRKLFDNAKASEVSSFIRSEAVRRCLSVSEQNKAKDSQRILKARWVLVWKPVPEESRQEARSPEGEHHLLSGWLSQSKGENRGSWLHAPRFVGPFLQLNSSCAESTHAQPFTVHGGAKRMAA